MKRMGFDSRKRNQPVRLSMIDAVKRGTKAKPKAMYPMESCT